MSLIIVGVFELKDIHGGDKTYKTIKHCEKKAYSKTNNISLLTKILQS